MTSRATLKENIRAVYFGLISEASLYSYEELLANVAKELSNILKTTYVGLYLYNESQHLYLKMEDGLTVPDFLVDINQYADQLYRQLNKAPFTNGEAIFPLDSTKGKIFVINMKAKYEPVESLLVLVHEETIEDTALLLIKNETERLLNLVNYYQENIVNEKKNELLFSLSSRLHSSTDKNIVLNLIVESLHDIYPAFSHHLLLSHDFETADSLPIKTIEYSDDKEKQSSSQAFITGEVQIEERSNPKHTCLYAPLLGNQGVYGVIQMIAPKVMSFTQSELRFIAQVSKISGQALENAILYENSVERASDLKLINNATHRLNSYLGLSELVQIFKDELTSICNPSEIGLIYFNKKIEQGYTIFSESTSFFKEEEGKIFVDFIYKQTSKKAEAIFSGDYSTIYPNSSYHSVISIPMVESDQTFGFIIAMHERKTYFTFEKFKLTQALTHHATLALVNTILRDKLEKAVITDYLTGLYSRRYLDKMFSEHMQTDKRGTFILFDIDDFKKINDTYGHTAGDKVIITIANIIRNCITKQDIAARWGGEEFAIYLPHVGLIKGVQVAEDIRKKVAEKTNPSVTFSCGVSTWSEEYTDSVSDVFIRADRALYEAKEIGKNRVIIVDQLNGYVKQ